MKAEMLSSLNRCYTAVEANDSLVIAALLDPRFKNTFFSGAVEQANARELLEENVAEVAETDVQEPSPKHPRTDLLDCFSEIAEEAGATISSNSCSEVDKYLSEPLIPFHQGKTQLAGTKQNPFSTFSEVGSTLSICTTYIGSI